MKSLKIKVALYVIVLLLPYIMFLSRDVIEATLSTLGFSILLFSIVSLYINNLYHILFTKGSIKLFSVGEILCISLAFGYIYSYIPAKTLSFEDFLSLISVVYSLFIIAIILSIIGNSKTEK